MDGARTGSAQRAPQAGRSTPSPAASVGKAIDQRLLGGLRDPTIRFDAGGAALFRKGAGLVAMT